MDRRVRSGWKRPVKPLLVWVLIGAMLAGCGGGSSGGSATSGSTGGVTVTTGLQGLKASRMSDGALYFSATDQGSPVTFTHTGAAGAGTWTTYSGPSTNRVQYSFSDTAGLTQILAMDTGLRMTVQTVGTERVEYRNYAANGSFVYGAVLYQYNGQWLMGLMFTEAFNGYGDLAAVKDVTAQIQQGLTVASSAGSMTAAGHAQAMGLRSALAAGPTEAGASLQGFAWSSIKQAAAAGVLAVSAVAGEAAVASAATAIVTTAGAVVASAATFLASPVVLSVAAGVMLGSKLADYKAKRDADAALAAEMANTSVDTAPASATVTDYQTQTQPTTYTPQPAPVPPAPTVPSPQVSSVTPSTATVGQVVNLVVSGTGLGGFYGLNVTWDGCTALSVMGGTDTSKTYQCTPATKGSFGGRVTDPVSKAVLSSFTVNVTDVPASGFTKISASGQDLPDTAPTWSCVRHNATGLLWEAHVTLVTPPPTRTCNPPGGGISNCVGYTNFGDGRAYDASSVPALVGSLCGRTGWRLPTEVEGNALVNDPAWIGCLTSGCRVSMVAWFDDTAYWGWTSTSVIGSPELAMGIHFGVGYVGSDNRDGSGPASGPGASVRLVAGP